MATLENVTQRIITTSTDPVRYKAFDNEGVLVLANDRKYLGGRELAVITMSGNDAFQNDPERKAMVYGSVVHHAGSCCLYAEVYLDLLCTYTTRDRMFRDDQYIEAIDWMCGQYNQLSALLDNAH